MAGRNVQINSVQYNNVPEVDVPLVGGGTAKFYDTSDATADASEILTGNAAYGANGIINGSMANNGSTSGTISTKAGTVTVPAGYTTGGTISIASSAVSDLVSGNLLAGKTVLGISGSLAMPTISQDSVTKILSIS